MTPSQNMSASLETGKLKLVLERTSCYRSINQSLTLAIPIPIGRASPRVCPSSDRGHRQLACRAARDVLTARWWRERWSLYGAQARGGEKDRPIGDWERARLNLLRAGGRTERGILSLGRPLWGALFCLSLSSPPSFITSVRLPALFVPSHTR